MSEGIMTNISDELLLFTCTEYNKDKKKEILELGEEIMKKCSLVCQNVFVSLNVQYFVEDLIVVYSLQLVLLYTLSLSIKSKWFNKDVKQIFLYLNFFSKKKKIKKHRINLQEKKLIIMFRNCNRQYIEGEFNMLVILVLHFNEA